MHRLKTAALTVFLLTQAMPSSAQNGDHLVTAPEKAVELGVASYRAEVIDSSAVVELLTFEKSVSGRMDISWNLEEGHLIELDQPAAHLLLFYDPVNGKLRLSDLRSGEVASGELKDGRWAIDEASRTLLDLYAEEIALISEIHDDVYFKHVETGGVRQWLDSKGVKQGAAEGKWISPADPCPPTCGGTWARGSSYGALSRSHCCEKARQDANLLCWNDHCTGCCFFLECDAYCAVGDYLCTPCGITGRRCSSSGRGACCD